MGMLILALVACTSGPPVVAEGELPGGLPVHEIAFPNGLRAIVAPDASAPVVAVQAWYAVGSADDPPGKGGVAHLFEHLMFQRTSEWGDGEFDARLGAAGAVGVNAWTWLDETVFVEAVPKEALPLVLHMEAVRMSALVVDDAAVETEKKVVLDERGTRVTDDPTAVVREAVWTAAFPGHPYGRPTSGAREEVAALTTADCLAFYREHYTPDHATLVIAGDVDPDEVAALIEQEFGAIPASGSVREPLPAAGDVGEPVHVALTSAPADRVTVGIRIPPRSSADLPALEVLDAALTGGQSSVLRRALEKGGFAATVDSRIDGFRGESIWEIGAWGHDGIGADTLGPVLDAALADVREHGIAPEDIERGRAQVLAQRYRQIEDASGRAAFLGWYAIGAGDWRTGAAHTDAIAKVTAEDVDRVARDVLAPERIAHAAGWALAARVVTTARPSIPPPPDVGPDVAARELGEALPRGVEDFASHGGTVHLEADPASPLVSVEIGWPVGSAADPAPGVANLAARALLRGSTTRGRDAFEAAVERLGAGLEVDVDPDLTVLRGRVPAEKWPAFAALLAEAITHPAYDEAEVAQLAGEMTNRVALRRNDPSALGLRTFNATFAGPDHPYGKSPLGTRESLPTLDAATLRAFHDRWLVSGGAVVSVTGAIDAAARDDAAALLAGIEGQPPAREPLPAVAPAGRRVVLVDDPGLTQAFVVVGGAGPDARAESYAAYRLGNDAFGGPSFTSRLVKEVRVARGLSYSVTSGAAVRASGTGAWAVTLSPPVDRAGEAVGLVLDLLAKAKASGLSADELAQVRAQTSRSTPFLADTAAKRGDLAFRRLLVGWDEADVRRRMAEADDAAANAAFQAVLAPGSELVVVVGPASVADQLAPYGTVEVVPADSVR